MSNPRYIVHDKDATTASHQQDASRRATRDYSAASIARASSDQEVAQAPRADDHRRRRSRRDRPAAASTARRRACCRRRRSRRCRADDPTAAPRRRAPRRAPLCRLLQALLRSDLICPAESARESERCRAGITPPDESNHTPKEQHAYNQPHPQGRRQDRQRLHRQRRGSRRPGAHRRRATSAR